MARLWVGDNYPILVNKEDVFVTVDVEAPIARFDVISEDRVSWTLVNGVHTDVYGDFQLDAFGNLTPEGTVTRMESSLNGEIFISLSEVSLPLEDMLFPETGYGEMCFSGDDVITGSQLNDNICALSGNDTVFGRGGLDTLIGNQGKDFLQGNAGNDSLFGGQGDDKLAGGGGDDFLQGALGNDIAVGAKGSDVVCGGQGDDVLSGGPGNDVLAAGQGNDVLSGGQHNDIAIGAKGNDVLSGGPGNDVLAAGQGNDQLRGSAGNDQLFGARGDDRLNGGVGDDVLTGGEGEDVFVFDQPGEGIYTGADTITDFVLEQDLIEIAAQVNDTDISSDDDVLQRLSPDGAGGTLIDLGDGNSIHLIGIDPASLDEGDFFII